MTDLSDQQPDPPLVSEYQPDDIDPEEIAYADDAAGIVTDRGDVLAANDDDRPAELDADPDDA